MSKEMMEHAKGAIAKHEKKPKHGVHRTHVTHHNDGSHTIEHDMHPMEDGTPREPITYSKPDDASMLQGVGGQLGAGEPGGAPADGAAA